MSQQTIDLRPADLAIARAVGHVAQGLATDRAERETPGFRERAEAAILDRLKAGPASGEDLTDHVASTGLQFADGRALGSVYASLRRRGWIEAVGTCARRKGHGGQGGSIYALAQTYEAQKAAWLAGNPAASAEAVESACQAIAERLGV